MKFSWIAVHNLFALITMDSKYASQYRSMNVNHLLDDELEYELVLRKVEYSSGESGWTEGL